MPRSGPHRFTVARRPIAAAFAFALGLPATLHAGHHGARPGAEARLGDNPAGRTILVTNCNDAGPGSLREAYALAGDDDTVDLNALTCSSITLASPLQSASSPGYVTVAAGGNGPVTITGNGSTRVFEHGDGRLTLRGLIVRGGRAGDAAGGGCVLSQGEVVLQQSRLTGCETSTTGSTPALGGAVRAVRLVALIDSEVSDSSAHAANARAEGGGVHGRYLIVADSVLRDNVASAGNYQPADGGGAWAERSVTIDRSTLSGNRATRGGGLFASNALFDEAGIVNSTISGNRADGAGGGIHAMAPVALHNSTITGNTAMFDFGAGVYVGAGQLVANSAIVAGNSSGGGLNASDVGGHAGLVVTGERNLIIASSRPLPAGTLQVDPMLGPLADNGGFKWTHALLPGSPAIDAGSNPLHLQTDQRFIECPSTLARGCRLYERVVGDSADIGAFEHGAPDGIFHNGFDQDLRSDARPQPATTYLSAVAGRLTMPRVASA